MTYSNGWNRRIYSWWAPIYDLLIRFHPVSRVRKSAFDLAELDSARTVLLVGAGTGVDLAFLDEQSLVIAVDLSSSMLLRTQQRSITLSRKVVCVGGDAQRLPFANDVFDRVILSLIVSVVPNPVQCLTEAVRCVAPGGRVLIVDKFQPADRRPSVLRRIINVVTRFFGTDINRRWEVLQPEGVDVLADTRNVFPMSMRAIVLQKR
ncbi:MAG: methyltransferase domain-containing protein [Planctomycetaceae bacterium]